MPRQPKVAALVSKLGELKRTEAQIKAQIKQITVDLYMTMSKLGTDKVGTNDIGTATAVYKTEIMISPQGRERIQPIDDAIIELKANIEVKQEERAEVEKALLMEGLAKEDKQFSFIKYTGPKKKEAVTETK